jgi:DNA mismatch repair protein MLH1
MLTTQSIAKLLLAKSEMIDEYFSISLTPSGAVESIPMMLKGYTPDLDRLPNFLLCLGARVNWGDEKECFKSILKEIAYFYSPRSPSDNSDSDEVGEEREQGGGGEEKHKRWQLEHILWPSMRRYTHWKRESLSNGDLKQVANLPDLFRIFERC